MSKKKIKFNKSKTYLLPLISEVIKLEPSFFKYLRNTYIFDKNGEYEDCIFIEHEFNFKNPAFTKYEYEMTNNQYFVDLIDLDNTVVYVFKFPEEYMHEYNSFKEGKYSKFKKDAKELILDFYSTIYSNNMNAIPFIVKVKQILFKDKKLKQQIEKSLSSRDHKVILDENAELTDIIDEENETFVVKEKVKKEL